MNEQTVATEWISTCGGKSRRKRFICPSCYRGCYYLHDKGGAFVCRWCAGVVRKPNARRMERAIALRKKLRVGPFPAPLPIVAPPWSRANWYLRRAEVQCLEASLYDDLDALLDDVERLAVVLVNG